MLNFKLESRLFTEGLVQHTPIGTSWLDVDLASFAPATSFGGGAAAKTPASRLCP